MIHDMGEHQSYKEAACPVVKLQPNSLHTISAEKRSSDVKSWP